jgi:hypothetical protein
MRIAVLVIGLVAMVAFEGCSRNGQPFDAGVGDASISSGTGGEGAGPTGTQGNEPADNPAADGAGNP